MRRTISAGDPGEAARSWHASRTEDTKTRILDAAQEVFVAVGFERAQLEEVATRAGYTRGAIYAHYSSKEDLFLALVEQRVLANFEQMIETLRGEEEQANRIGMFRSWMVAQVSDPSFGTLMLEFKLHAVRGPQSLERLQALHDAIFRSTALQFVALLFGTDLPSARREGIERRLAVMGSVLSAVALERRFRPQSLSCTDVQTLAAELLDVLVRP